MSNRKDIFISLVSLVYTGSNMAEAKTGSLPIGLQLHLGVFWEETRLSTAVL